MNKEAIRRLVYLVILVVLLAVTKYFKGIGNHPSVPADVITNMRSADIIYTKHAKCRMDCREISQAEVIETLEQGSWNRAKSDLNDQPCPTYVLEDRSEEGQLIRVVFAYCEDVVKVVTAIDLENEYSCYCK